MTPEGKIKSEVKTLLHSYGIMPAKDAALFTPACRGWYFMPVSNGMGVTGIPDFIGHFRGSFFAVETKTKGKKPTALQQHQLNAISISGAKSFVIDGDLEELKSWLEGE